MVRLGPGAMLLAGAMTLLPGTRVEAQRPVACNAQPAPALGYTVTNLRGQPTPLERFRGKILLLNFWATWCVPCRREMPDLDSLQAQFRSRGVEILGVDVGEPAATVERFLMETPVRYTIAQVDEHDPILSGLGIDRGLPTTVVVRRDGTVCRVRVGLTSRGAFEQLLQLLLSEDRR